MNRFALYLFLLLIFISSCSSKDNKQPVNLRTKTDSISYVIGLDYGEGIKNQEFTVNQDLIYRGLTDGLNGTSALPDSVKIKLITTFQSEIDQKEQVAFEKMLAENKKKGKEFLDENSKNPGVEVLPDGLQYKILKQGTGNKPQRTDSVTIHYRAMFIDRLTFDMSYDRGPVGIRLNETIKGLSQGITLMRTGSIYEFYIPSDLAYGDVNFQNLIPAGSVLIYSVELIQIH